jgi:carbamate kinase
MDTLVILVNGEVLADGRGSAINYKRYNAIDLAESLLPLFASNLKIAVLHGNKPQIGFV